jgi:hypothetical protein
VNERDQEPRGITGTTTTATATASREVFDAAALSGTQVLRVRTRFGLSRTRFSERAGFTGRSTARLCNIELKNSWKPGDRAAVARVLNELVGDASDVSDVVNDAVEPEVVTPTPPAYDLPDGPESGVERTWRLATVSEDDPLVRAGVLEVDARFLGVGSSRRQRHILHPGRYATRSERCGVCRWFETRIFRVGENEYVLHHTGRSIVPGERSFMRHERAFSGPEVIERYTVRPGDADPFLARPAARALAQAAAHDDVLRDAYENRAVL